jgi:Ca2+-binding EF-hand superfamily protein
MSLLKKMVWVLLCLCALTVQAKPQMGTPPDMFKVFDANADGRVTEEEYINAVMEQVKSTFSRMDLNGDGVVTREENDEIANKMREMLERRMPSRK